MTGQRSEAGVSTVVAAVGGVLAVLAVVVGGVVAQRVGDDDGAAAEPAAGTSTSESRSGSVAEESDDASTAPTTSPTREAWLKEAVVAAKDGFPAFVPAEVPRGWTVEDAAYGKDSRWTMAFTSPSGAAVSLHQRRGAEVRGVVDAQLGSAREAGEVNLTRWGTGRWQAYEGRDGRALGSELARSAVVVSGDTTQEELVEVTRLLLTAEWVVNVGDGSDG